MEEARATLTKLHRDVVQAEDQLVTAHAACLLEANEWLTISALNAHVSLESSVKELKDMSRAMELDPLTELPNRALLLDRFGQATANARRSGTWLALMFLDLDNFKQINDTFGHSAGDQALKLAARCLVASVRSGDTVCRHGGDEFLILLVGMSQATDATLVAEKVIAALGAPHELGNQIFQLKTSIGISIFPDDGEDAETLIDKADAAMYLAKKRGLGRFMFHDQGSASERPPPSSARR
jgi:diguanylate cyclase (GGDEF)-like protein